MKKFYLVVGALALCLSTSVFSGGINSLCYGGCDGKAPNPKATTKQCGWTSTITTAPDRRPFSLDAFKSCTSSTPDFKCGDDNYLAKNPPTERGILTCTTDGNKKKVFSCENLAGTPSSQGTTLGKAGSWCKGTKRWSTQETSYSCQVDNSDKPNAKCNFPSKINYNP
jgi:hypothetical protein